MSRVNARELRGLTFGELEEKRRALEKELHALRQKRVSGQLDKPHLFKEHRRQIARILTVKKENEDARQPRK